MLKQAIKGKLMTSVSLTLHVIFCILKHHFAEKENVAQESTNPSDAWGEWPETNFYQFEDAPTHSLPVSPRPHHCFRCKAVAITLVMTSVFKSFFFSPRNKMEVFLKCF